MAIRRIRAAAVIVQDGRLLLMRRVKRGHEYIVFAGGGVERGESVRAGLKREIQEEFSLNVAVGPVVDRRVNRGQLEYYFLVTRFTGEPQLGGEEAEAHSERNQYHPTWYTLRAVVALPHLYPVPAKWAVLRWLVRHGHAPRDLLAQAPARTPRRRRG